MPKRKRRSKRRRKGKSKRKKKKTGVKRPMTSFICFSQYNRPLVKKKYPEMGLKDVSRKLGQLWGKLREDQKAMWKKRAKEDHDKAIGEPQIVRRRAQDVERAKKARQQPSNRARVLHRAASSLQSLNRHAVDLDSKLPWMCKTCHKKNIPAHASCAVCGAPKNMNSIQPPLPSKVYKAPNPVKPIVPSKFKYPRLRNVLTKLELERFYPEFETQEVGLETLVELVRTNDPDLKELVGKIGPRREIKSFIEKHYIKQSIDSDEETLIPQDKLRQKRKTPPPLPSPKRRKTFEFISESDSESSDSDPPILYSRKESSPVPHLSTFSQFERRENEPVKEEAMPPVIVEKRAPADPPKQRQLPAWCLQPLTKPFPRPEAPG